MTIGASLAIQWLSRIEQLAQERNGTPPQAGLKKPNPASDKLDGGGND